MSAAKRQQTCAACGRPFYDGERTDLEPLIDGVIRYLAVHPKCTTHPPIRIARSSRAERTRRTYAHSGAARAA